MQYKITGEVRAGHRARVRHGHDHRVRDVDHDHRDPDGLRLRRGGRALRPHD